MTHIECTGDKAPASPALAPADCPLHTWVQDAAKEHSARSTAEKADKATTSSTEVNKILGDFAITGESEPWAKVAADATAGMITGITLSQMMRRFDAPPAPVEAPPNIRATDTPMIDPTAFNVVAKTVLAKIDTAHSGLITRAQLAAAMQNPAFTDQEAQAVTAMYKNFDNLHNLSSHEWMWNTASITPGDLDNYQATATARFQKASETSALKDWAHTHLLIYCSPGCETITRDDIEAAYKRPHLKDQDRQMLDLLKKYYGEMDSMFNFSGISEADINKLADGVWKDAPGKMVSGVWASCYETEQGAQRKGICYDLYSDKDPLKSIKAEAVKQGKIGDCYFEAAIAALATSNPAAIRNCITDNHNGTFTVNFPGAPGEPITVNAPTEAELGEYNHGSEYGIWASVIEKAYGKYRDNHAGNHALTPQEGADGGGQPLPVIKLITGSDSDFLQVGSTSEASMAAALEKAIKSHKAIETGINADNSWSAFFGMGTDKTSDNFYMQHEYTIVGFEPDGKGSGTVIVRNPWGLTDDTPDGKVRIPLKTFMKNFSDVTIQR